MNRNISHIVLRKLPGSDISDKVKRANVIYQWHPALPTLLWQTGITSLFRWVNYLDTFFSFIKNGLRSLSFGFSC
jgi:transposase